jgi:hypothetical protein
MFIAKTRSVVIVATTVATLGFAGFTWLQASAQPAVGEPKASDLLVKRRDVVREEFELRRKAFADGHFAEATPSLVSGGGSFRVPTNDHEVKDLIAAMNRGKLLDASQRLLRVEIDLASDTGGRRAVHVALVAQVDRLKAIEKIIRERVAAEKMPRVAQLEIESIRLEAEFRAQRE